MGWPDWLPYMIVLEKTGANTFEITIPLPEGISIDYLLNRQSWETVERSLYCDVIPNHKLTVQEPTTIELTVAAWSDIQCGGE